MALTDRVSALVMQWWAQVNLDDLPRTHQRWLDQTVAGVQQAQRIGATLSSAYLAAYVATELGKPPSFASSADTAQFIGSAADGQPLDVPLSKTIIAVRAALKDQKPPAEALAEGATKGTRLATAATMSSARGSLAQQIETPPEVIGWHRVTRGGCGACLASATRLYEAHEPFPVHDHCRCTAEPVVKDIPDRFPRTTGPEIFAAMSRQEQDQALGPAAAQAVREGRVAWPELIGTSPMEIGPNVLTQAPLPASTQ